MALGYFVVCPYAYDKDRSRYHHLKSLTVHDAAPDFLNLPLIP